MAELEYFHFSLLLDDKVEIYLVVYCVIIEPTVEAEVLVES